MTFTEEQLERYSRHIILKGVGAAGQKKLLSSKVLVIGAGGLGSPALMYLAASGIGTIGIMDGDRVDMSNLQRQIIHDTDKVGEWKVTSAAESIGRMNPDVHTILYKERATAENLPDILPEYDFVIDAVDNFAGKFLINDACVLAKKPFCHAGVRGFYGQLMTYVPGQGPCYRCVFEEIPEGGDIDSCSQAGILGTMPGILGTMQALEAQKYILGVGELMTGKMYTFDAATMKTRIIPLQEPAKHCKVCGEHPVITSLLPENYEVQNSCAIQEAKRGNIS